MSAWAVYRRLFRIARPYWLHVGALFALTLAAVPLALLTPLPLKLAVDSAIGNEPLPWFVPAVLASTPGPEWRIALLLAITTLLATALLTQFQHATRALLSTYVSSRLVLLFRSELFRQVQRLSLSYHDTKGAGDTLYRIQYDATVIQSIVIDGVIPFVTAVATVAAMLFVSLRIDITLALVALTIVPLLALLITYFQPRLRAVSKTVRRLDSSAMSVVQETLGAVRVVKTFGQEDREQSRFRSQAEEGLAARLSMSKLERAMGMWVGLVTAVGTAAVLFVGVTHVREASLTVGNLLLIMGYLGSMYSPLRTISDRIARLQQHLTSAERAFALLDHAPDVTERPNAIPLARSRGMIEYDHVTFSYDGATAVLQDVTLTIPAGSRVGIVGATGAGKTTLVNLLLRLYDPTRGAIRLDNVDLREYRLADLRNQFAVVLQEPVLFSATIAENIAYAKPDASEEEIRAAAMAANAHEFIIGLSSGYQTQVGERGMRLSGGERQRISLARAFLRDAPILVLDEPTSSVDSQTESLIISAMRRLMDGRTTFMIAHRLSTLDSCDLVLTIADGTALLAPRSPSTLGVATPPTVGAHA